MTFRVICERTGEAFAKFAVHQFEHALAAALDLANIKGEHFAVATAARAAWITVTPQQKEEMPPQS